MYIKILPGFYTIGRGWVVWNGEAELLAATALLVARVVVHDVLVILGENLDTWNIAYILDIRFHHLREVFKLMGYF